MRRALVSLVVAAFFALVGAGGALGAGNPNKPSCPPASHAPGVIPPNCGHTPPSPPPPPPPPPPAACGFDNPPTGPISGIVGQVGEAIGDNQVGNLVVDVGCAVQKNLGL